MAAPSFTAEASLYMTARSYRGGTGISGDSQGTEVVAQQGSGCTVECADWNSCNQTCGEWPPGLSNYNCWLDCLKPSVNCLNSTCTPPPPPPPCCPFGRSCKCGGRCIPGRGCVGGECLAPGEFCR